mgnify:CR=1 FL=1
MWFKFKKDKIQNKNILYLSIDGRSIGMSLYTGNNLIFTDRKIYIKTETHKSIELLFTEFLKSFKNSHSILLDEICVILENPWVTENQAHIKEKRLSPFVVTQNVIDNLVNRNTDGTMNKNSIPYIFEKIVIDGHIDNSPIGKTVNEIEISLTKFNEDTEFALFIDRKIKELWNKTQITYTAGISYAINIAKKYKAKNDIYITLGSSSTTIRFYAMGIIHNVINIPYGFQNILESLGFNWQTSSFETRNWLNLFLDKKLSAIDYNRINNDIRMAFMPFVNNFSKIIENNETPQALRPIKIFGISRTWNRLFNHLLLEDEYFTKVFPHIKNTAIIDIAENLHNVSGDRLISTYITNKELSI